MYSAGHILAWIPEAVYLLAQQGSTDQIGHICLTHGIWAMGRVGKSPNNPQQATCAILTHLPMRLLLLICLPKEVPVSKIVQSLSKVQQEQHLCWYLALYPSFFHLQLLVQTVSFTILEVLLKVGLFILILFKPITKVLCIG